MKATVLRARYWVGAFVTSGAMTAACIGFEVDYDGFCAQRPEHQTQEHEREPGLQAPH